jgi:GDP-L-fucose synthase
LALPADVLCSTDDLIARRSPARMNPDDAIFVAGHNGMAGSALVRALRARGFANLVLRTRKELDLLDPKAVRAFYEQEKPAYVFLAAAKVGGIHANNTYPVEFISENLQIEINVINGAAATGTKKLLFLGSSCIYPKFAPQPISEDALLTGPLEPTNEPYALAKICGVRLCQAQARQHGKNFISAMPTNLYGPGDNYDLENSHVIPGLLHRFRLAKLQGKKSVTLWGSGSPRREFLHADDLAEACVFLMERDDAPDLINVGVGEDITIKELAEMVGRIVEFTGDVIWDTQKPDGTPRKILDVSRLSALGWKARIPLEQGIREAYRWWLENGKNVPQ